MRIPQRYKGTFIGGVFTAAHLLLSFTFMPFFIVLPGFLVKQILSGLAPDILFLRGPLTTLVLAIPIIVISILGYRQLSKSGRQQKSVPGEIILLAMLGYTAFIFTFGFFLYWTCEDLTIDEDESVFAMAILYPAFSVFFLMAGALSDWLTLKCKNKARQGVASASPKQF